MTNAELKQRAEAICALEEQIADLKVEVKASFEIAKGQGYDVRALRQIVRELRAKPEQRQAQLEFELVVDTYRQAVGLETEFAPLPQRKAA